MSFVPFFFQSECGAPQLKACLRNRETQANLELELIYRKFANFIGGKPGSSFLQEFPQEESSECREGSDGETVEESDLRVSGSSGDSTQLAKLKSSLAAADTTVSVAVQTLPVRILPPLESDFYVEHGIQTMLLPP